MARKKRAQSEVELAPVEDYPEKTDDVRTDEETEEAEARYSPDQIPDYEEQHPHIDTSGPEHDPVVQAELRGQSSVLVEEEPQD